MIKVPIRTALSLLLLLAFNAGWAAAPISALKDPCDGSFAVSLQSDHSISRRESFFADEIRVTGPDVYSTAMILKALNINSEQLSEWRIQSDSDPEFLVASIGEGYSNFVYDLQTQGDGTGPIRSVGIDLWYDKSLSHLNDSPEKRAIQEFLIRTREHLLSGDATDLPLNSNSVSVYVSNLLVNNYPDPAADALFVGAPVDGVHIQGVGTISFELYRTLKEAARVTRSGGIVKIYGILPHHLRLVQYVLLGIDKVDPASIKFTLPLENSELVPDYLQERVKRWHLLEFSIKP